MAFSIPQDSSQKRQLETSPDIELAIMKKESERAGINYLWHPRFREYAKNANNYPMDYEALLNDPKNKLEKDKHQKLLEPFSRQEWLGDLLSFHPDKRDLFGHIDPYTRMSEGELIARYDYMSKGNKPEANLHLPQRTETGPVSFSKSGLIKIAQNNYHHTATDQAEKKLSTPQRALKYTGQNEGGYINDIADKGKETFKGLSRNANPDWEGWNKIDPDDPIIPAPNIGDATRTKLVKVLSNPENQHLFRALLTKALSNHFKDRVAYENQDVPKEKRQAKYLKGWLNRARRWPEQE